MRARRRGRRSGSGRITLSVGTPSAMIDRKSNSISGSGMNISLALAWGSQSAKSVWLPGFGQAGGQVDRRCRLAHSPFEVRHANDLCCHRARSFLCLALLAGDGNAVVALWRRHAVA